MVKSKKAISPVVATALLLVVAVVAVVGFQNWFGTYQSGITGQAEEQSGSDVQVGRLEANGIIYIKNTGSSEVNITNISIQSSTGTHLCSNASIDANIAADSLSGANDLNDGSCGLSAGTSYDVIIFTPGDIFQRTAIAR